eukprot:SAG31_NODE_335_length_17509_cov_7.127972_22_plen_111_part_00
MGWDGMGWDGMISENMSPANLPVEPAGLFVREHHLPVRASLSAATSAGANAPRVSVPTPRTVAAKHSVVCESGSACIWAMQPDRVGPKTEYLFSVSIPVTASKSSTCCFT